MKVKNEKGTQLIQQGRVGSVKLDSVPRQALVKVKHVLLTLCREEQNLSLARASQPATTWQPPNSHLM